MIKQIIKELVPQFIKDSAIGDAVRFFRSVQRKTPEQSSSSRREHTSSSEETEVPSEPEEYDVEVFASQLLEWRESDRAFVLLDIREPHELQYGLCKDSWVLPMNGVPNELPHLPKDIDLVVACAAGVRSWSVAQYLRQQGFDKAWSLENGVPTWAEQGWVTPSRGKFSVGSQVRIPIEHEVGQAEYGFIAGVSTEDGEVVYHVQVWSLNGTVEYVSLPEEEVSYFVP